MRWLGVGSRLSILATSVAMLGELVLVGLLLGGQFACSTADAGEVLKGAELLSASASGEPQQVVQRIVSGVSSGSVAASSAPSAQTVPVPGAAANGGISPAGSLAPRSNSVETITSRHLEAELNRLEAELAN